MIRRTHDFVWVLMAMMLKLKHVAEARCMSKRVDKMFQIKSFLIPIGY